MHLDELPDLALHHIFLYCQTKDIGSLQTTNRKFCGIIKRNRNYYSQYNYYNLSIIKKENGQREIVFDGFGIEKRTNLPGKLEDLISSVSPRCVYSHDHEELANMSPKWWEQRREIALDYIVDYRRYSRFFDRFSSIHLVSDLPKNLSEILQFKETKNLTYLVVEGDGELECTNEDLMRIARLSNQLWHLKLTNISESSIISCETILDMLEIGSFESYGSIKITKTQDRENFDDYLKKREWVINYIQLKQRYKIKSNNGREHDVQFLEKR